MAPAEVPTNRRVVCLSAGQAGQGADEGDPLDPAAAKDNVERFGHALTPGRFRNVTYTSYRTSLSLPRCR